MAFWIVFFLGIIPAWALLSRRIHRDGGDMPAVVAVLFGGLAALFWPVTLIGLAIMWWIERPPPPEPLTPKPPAGGPFR